MYVLSKHYLETESIMNLKNPESVNFIQFYYGVDHWS